MLKAIIISDSHGDLKNVRKIAEKEHNIDLVIHLGDLLGQDEQLAEIFNCEIKKVKGNCDYYSNNPVSDVVEFGGNRIFITHGHNYGVDFGPDGLSYAAEENKCNIALYGHTHVPDSSIRGKIIIVNPGSVSRPRQLGGRPTYGVMKVNKEGKADIRIEYV